MKKVIGRGKRNKTLNEVKPVMVSTPFLPAMILLG